MKDRLNAQIPGELPENTAFRKTIHKIRQLGKVEKTAMYVERRVGSSRPTPLNVRQKT